MLSCWDEAAALVEAAAVVVAAAEKEEVDRTEGEKKRTVSDMFMLVATPTGSLSPDGVPHIAVEVIIAGHEQPARLAERHGGDATDDIVV